MGGCSDENPLPAVEPASTAIILPTRPEPPVHAPWEVTLEGHGGRGVLYSRDGTRLLTWDHEAAQVWDARTWEKVGEPLEHGAEVARTWTKSGTAEPDNHKEEILSAEFDATGNRVLTTGYHAIVWDLKSSKPRSGALKHNGKQLTGAALSPNGQFVATCRYDERNVYVLQADTGRLEQTFEHRAPIEYVQFDREGTHLITTSSWEGDCLTRLWDLKLQELRFTLPIERPNHSGVKPSLSANGLILIATGANCDVYEIATGKRILKHTEPSRAGFLPPAIAISADGSMFQSDVKLDAGIWSVKDGSRLLGFNGTWEAALDPTGQTFIQVGEDWGGIYGVKPGIPLRECKHQWGAATYSPDGRQIALACWTKTVVLLSGQGKTAAERWSVDNTANKPN